MKKFEAKDLLVIGIGNYGRKDDALAWKFLDRLTSLDFKGTVEYRYQLQVEDAELISKYPKVIFVDASIDQHMNGFAFFTLEMKYTPSFTSHAIAPDHILYLCHDLYGHCPKAYMMAISGKEWGLHIGLSQEAKSNLDKAWSHLKPSLI